MARRRKLLLVLTACAAVLIGSLAVGVRTLLPVWLRGAVERFAGETLDRQLRISGAFDLSLSLTPTLEAADVSLANAPWGSEPSMVLLRHLKVSVDLASLWSRPVRVRELEIEGVRIVIETDADGRGNWRFPKKGTPAPSPRPAAVAGSPVVFDHLAIRDFELSYRRRQDAPPLRVGIARLDARHEAATGMIDLDAAGYLNDAPWDVAGKLGTLDRLFELRDVEHAVTGHIGGSTVAIRGRIRDPLALGDPNLQFDLEGPDIVAALATIGLRSPVSGPFHLRGRMSPGSAGVDVDLTAGLAGVSATARGTVGALLKPGAIGATVEVEGPDARVVGEWTRLSGLPPGPFAVSGRVRLEAPRLFLDDVKARAGGTSVTVSGVLGKPPRCVGTDLAVTGVGRNLSELSALTRLRLPAGAFTVRGRFLRRADALAVEDVEVRIRDAVVRGSGTIGEPPRLPNLDLIADAAGPDLARFSEFAKVPLPHEPFALRGRIARRDTAFELYGVEGRVGDNAVHLQGRLVPARRLVGTDLHADVAGPDLAKAASLAGLQGLPGQPYEVSGQIGFADDGFDLEAIEARAGRISASARAHLGTRPAEGGTAIDFIVHGETLTDLAAWGVRVALPGDPFTVSGRLSVEDRVYRLDRAVAKLGGDRAAVDGTLGPLPDVSSLDVGAEIEGPRLRDLGRFLGTSADDIAKHLPAEPYVASGRVRRVPDGIELHEARAAVGNAELALDGTLGLRDRLRGTDVRFELHAPDASLSESLSGMTLPAGPVEAGGRIERLDAAIRLDAAFVSIGDARAEISGTIGEPPELVGTQLDVSLAGPDLSAVLGPITGLSPLPATGFEAAAHVEGSAGHLASDRFMARLGDSDVEGSISVRRDGKPTVEADLRSQRLSIGQMHEGFVEVTEEPAAPPQPAKHSARKRDRLIPDEPLTLDALRSLDARIRLKAGQVDIPGVPLRDVVVEGELVDGALRISRVEGTGRNGGRATANLSVTPEDGGYRLRSAGGLAGGKIDLSKTGESPEAAPSLDIEFAVEGAGTSLHAIAASSEGSALITMGPGRVLNNVNDFMTSGLLRGLFDALNPLRKSSPHTEVECGVAAAAIDGGKVVVAPIAARTDKLTVVGNGKIDLETEAIDLVWTLKPRKGVGISAASISNPYIKLGGTLSSPSLEAKALQAVASTGAAVATVGLTVLFKGIYDRITAERKVCVKALEKARKQEEAREARKSR